MESLRIVFFGTPAFAVPTLERLCARGEQVIAVVTQPDRPVGRGKTPQPPAVKRAAIARGLEVIQPERVRRASFHEWLAGQAPDVAVVVAFGQIFPAALLEIPRFGFINVHASLLPAYRGAAPINHAIMAGEHETGITIMQLDAGMDTGAIILQRATPIGAQETAAELHDRLALLGAATLIDALEQREPDGWPGRPQDPDRATYAPPLRKQDGVIDWSQPAGTISNRIRALTPWPGCVTRLNDQPLKIHAAVAEPAAPAAASGTVLAADAAGLVVACGAGVLRITELQQGGRKRLPAGQFLRGTTIPAGTRLGVD